MQQHRPIIQLPRQFDGQSLSKVAADLMKTSPHGLSPEIEFDFSNLGFARPAGVVFLSNFVQWLQQKGTQVHFTNIAKETASLRFLDDSLFFEQHCGQKVKATASPRSPAEITEVQCILLPSMGIPNPYPAGVRNLNPLSGHIVAADGESQDFSYAFNRGMLETYSQGRFNPDVELFWFLGFVRYNDVFENEYVRGFCLA